MALAITSHVPRKASIIHLDGSTLAQRPARHRGITDGGQQKAYALSDQEAQTFTASWSSRREDCVIICWIIAIDTPIATRAKWLWSSVSSDFEIKMADAKGGRYCTITIHFKSWPMSARLRRSLTNREEPVSQHNNNINNTTPITKSS